MLRDADFNHFAGVYIVCGYTDMSYGIDSLAAIIEQKYRMNLSSQTHCSCSAESPPQKLRVSYLLEGDGFLLITKRVECDRFSWPRTSSDLRGLSAEQFR